MEKPFLILCNSELYSLRKSICDGLWNDLFYLFSVGVFPHPTLARALFILKLFLATSTGKPIKIFSEGREKNIYKFMDFPSILCLCLCLDDQDFFLS